MQKLHYFPRRWKYTDGIMLLKAAKDGTFRQNYRLITLLPAISKVDERNIASRIEEHTEELSIWLSEHFGFRAFKLDSPTAVETSGVSANGLAKSFERVWHEVVVYKMSQLGTLDQHH